MKAIIFFLFLVILVSSCSTRSKNKIVYKYIEKPVYVKCKLPLLPEKPKFNSYQVIRVKFQERYYYCANEENAKILTQNWLKYKNWCENLNIIIKGIDK